MKTRICRVCVGAKPARTNREYEQFETADIIIFVKADGEEEALAKARAHLKKERWELLQVQHSDRLIDSAVRAEGGDFLALYKEAEAKGLATRIFPKNFAPGKKSGIPAIRPPRVTEEFIDQVVADVGGERLPTNDKDRIVDYRIGDYVFDLKDLQEEGLLKPERQEKLADLFAPYAVPGYPLQIDPEILTEDERRKFFDIISGPIQTQVKSTAKQIKSTREVLGNPNLKGGIIFLNSGYGSFPPEEFGPLVERYVRKDTKQIEAIFCVSTWAVTNGFSSNIFFRAYHFEPPAAEVDALKEAFGKRFEEAMTKLILGELPKAQQMADPLAPVTFAVNGLDFSWLPPEMPADWRKSPE
jgi:hypothetical protein